MYTSSYLEIKRGEYYRRRKDSIVVKVVYDSIFSMNVPDAPPIVVFRHNDDAYPHRYEYVFDNLFMRRFQGPLEWDPEKKEFK